MAKKKLEAPPGTAGALTHHPFAQLANKRELVGHLGKSPLPTTVIRARPQEPPAKAPVKLRLRLETKGHSGKAVTRVTGLPTHNLEVIASRLRKALGCGASVEGDDVLLQGSLAERASQWLDRAGDLHKLMLEPLPSSPAKPPEVKSREPTTDTQPSASGTIRADVRRGQHVAIVLKSDQDTGKLTLGVVRELLTNSEIHPRGIKVRLESGEVGRVKAIYK